MNTNTANEAGTTEKTEARTAPRPRGFAAMNSQKQREIARKGGKAAHEKGTAHEFTADEARAAGRKGGERVSTDRSHMANIGRMGGKNSAARRAAISQSATTDGDAKASEKSNGSNADAPSHQGA